MLSVKQLGLVLGLSVMGMEALAVRTAPGKIKKYYEESELNLQIRVSCDFCHVQRLPITDRTRNVFGQDVEANLNIKSRRPDFSAIEDLDSDGDGFTNLEEFIANTKPGDSESFPEE